MVKTLLQILQSPLKQIDRKISTKAGYAPHKGETGTKAFIDKLNTGYTKVALSPSDSDPEYDGSNVTTYDRKANRHGHDNVDFNDVENTAQLKPANVVDITYEEFEEVFNEFYNQVDLTLTEAMEVFCDANEIDINQFVINEEESSIEVAEKLLGNFIMGTKKHASQSVHAAYAKHFKNDPKITTQSEQEFDKNYNQLKKESNQNPQEFSVSPSTDAAVTSTIKQYRGGKVDGMEMQKIKRKDVEAVILSGKHKEKATGETEYDKIFPEKLLRTIVPEATDEQLRGINTDVDRAKRKKGVQQAVTRYTV